MQSVGLLFGTYLSQERVRTVLPGTTSTLVLGDNLEAAMVALAFNISSFPFATASQPQASAFVNWTRQALAGGAPVIAGMYLAQQNGDSDYDVIVPVVGVNGTVLWYNDLYGNATRTLALPGDERSRGNCVLGPSQQPFAYCLPLKVDYGVAVAGVNDPRKELLPVSLTVSR